MKRLTLDEIFKLVNKTAVQMELDNYKECSENYKQIAEYLEELKSYKEAEEQGLLVRLPCKVGDSVFIIVGKDISKQGIRKIEISDNGIIFKTNRQKRIFNVSEFGKTVFLTREEAEKKLEELRN